MLDNPMIAAEEARLERAFAHNDDPDAIDAMEEVAEILEARRLMLRRIRDALREMAESRDWSKTHRAAVAELERQYAELDKEPEKAEVASRKVKIGLASAPNGGA